MQHPAEPQPVGRTVAKLVVNLSCAGQAWKQNVGEPEGGSEREEEGGRERGRVRRKEKDPKKNRVLDIEGTENSAGSALVLGTNICKA